MISPKWRLILPVLLIGLLLGLGGCSTKKNKFMNRFWHSMNTKFNGYFNGNEALKAGMQDLIRNRHDNFTKIIPVYEYGDRSGFQAQNAQWDRAVKKGVIMIKKHSMLINGKQYNRYIDDCYLMMGIAHYFKLDFTMGIGQLRYVSESSEKKKTQDEAKIWMVRSYVEEGEMAEAATTIRRIDAEGLFPKLKPLYWASIAEYNIRNKEYEKAIQALDNAIEYEKKKKKKARYTFVKAQILQYLKDNTKAYETYAAVLKLKPEYELEFQSKINMARTAGKDSNEDLKKLLKKMLKDDKNIEYQDQIYYAIGSINLKENNKTNAILNFTKSVEVSINNKNQKGLSCLELARIYFADRKYEPAQAYYDSTATFLDKDHPEYETVVRLKENLTDVVLNIRIIQLQDSLQRLAQMDEKSLIAFLDDYVEDLKKQDEEAKFNQGNSLGNQMMESGEGKWYFYNTQALAFGRNEFKKVWGDRPLEDDWRRSNKSITSFSDVTNNEPAYNPRYDPLTYLKEVPRTDSMMKASNEMIWDALYNLGILYKEKIYDLELAAESFEDLVKRNTANVHFPLTYYQLYLIYRDMKNNEKADFYKSLIIGQYPNSQYAQILSNPDFMGQKDQSDDKASPLYEQAYNNYKNKDYATAEQQCRQAFSEFPESSVLHRFALLSALISKETSDMDTFKNALKDIIEKYPGTESAHTANRLWGLLTDTNTETKTDSVQTDNIKTATTVPYTKDLEAEHIVIIVIPSLKGNVTSATQKINQFNDDNFSLIGLSVNVSLMGSTTQMMLIRKFKNGNEAVNYLKLFNKKEMLNQLQLGQGVKVFSITMGNYALLFKNQDVVGYEAFYQTQYPQ